MLKTDVGLEKRHMYKTADRQQPNISGVASSIQVGYS